MKEVNILLVLFFTATSIFGQSTTNVKEILIMHHSHLDIGYTHLQPVAMELHKDFINQALTMLDNTSGWPDHSKPKWTCEVTEQVMNWMEGATQPDLERFAKYLKEGRIGISALEFNTTPLASSEGLSRQLYYAAEISKRFGIKINTANLHDATGLPWPIADLLKDGGVEMLIMAINLHLSGTPLPRPAVYRWQSPGGQQLLVMNGEHYTMFDQWTNVYTNNLDTIKKGLDRYLMQLESINYPYDFAYLSATCAPFAYDNSPPNFDLPGIVRKWNEEGRQPRLRFVTPADILESVKKIPYASIPVVKGDWTDFWNFGCASSAAETRLSLNTSSVLRDIDLLDAFGKKNLQLEKGIQKIWRDVKIYAEHTWGAFNTLDIYNPFVTAQWNMKAFPAYEGHALSKYVIVKQLQGFVDNPASSKELQGVLLINTTDTKIKYYARIPDDWYLKGKRLELRLMSGADFIRAPEKGRVFGPIEIEPFSWKKIPLTQLKKAAPENRFVIGKDFIESPFYRLKYNPLTGQITSLFDKKRNWEILDRNSQYGFFQYVHEKPDPAADPMRTAFHVRNVATERVGITGWKPGWKAAYSVINEKIEFTVDTSAFKATLIIRAQAEGVRDMEQRITLDINSPVIDLSCSFIKTDNVMPEGIYFTFPLNLAEGWHGYFDTGDLPVELDAEQIKGTSKDWVTVSSFAGIYNNDKGAVLYCPDAPMVLFGDFNFGRNHTLIERKKYPLLLAWPLNNYWETNFRGSQPGFVQLRYAFNSQGKYDPAKISSEAQQVLNSPIVHQIAGCSEEQSGQFINVKGEGIKVTYIKAADDGEGIIVRLVNLNRTGILAELQIPGSTVSSAWRCTTQEENIESLNVENSKMKILLKPYKLTTIRIRIIDR
jgi:alpha-mannosidase